MPRDIVLKGNERLFGMWCETFNELDGNPDKLKELITAFTINNTCNYTSKNDICNDIVQEIQNLPGGKKTVFEHFILDDAMVCSDLDIAYKFNDITRGSYIRKTNKKASDKPIIYKYNTKTQLWDSTTDLKTSFIDTIGAYMTVLNGVETNKEYFANKYSGKDEHETDI